MRKRLYMQMTAICIAVMLSTMAITASMFYRLFSNQVFDDLITDMNILKATTEYTDEAYTGINTLRITVVDNSGQVLFDNNVDIDTMENHLDRPEIQQAINTGKGKDVRRSSTVDKSTFYYAETDGSGNVIRVSKEVGSFWLYFKGIIPLLLVEMIITIVACLMIARLLARKIVEPIGLLAQNLNSEENMKGYDEIQPFLDKIHSQHKDLKLSTKVRQDFTANVSHELKTPLASISGYAELIETGMAKDEDVRRFAGEIHKSSNRLLSLINDIIELSQLDVMDHKMEVSEVNLGKEVIRIVDSLQVNASGRSVTISSDIVEENCFINANSQMLEELICNLCDNAIRYNKPNGNVWVSVFSKGDDIILIIKDDGIGIAKEEQPRIFERFYRVDKARSKETGGTGLGLAIVKHIAEQHDADIILESDIGKGTTISVIFQKYK